MASNLVHDFTYCPRCHHRLQPTQALTQQSEFWLECSNPDCNTYVNTYIPQPHQVEFHKDAHRITANFGGYGSGKTLTSREELEKHILITPAGNALVGANVASQYEQTIKRDFEADFPKAFIEYVSAQKGYVDFKNGYRVIYRPYDDPDKLRSYNLDFWLILEASEVKEESFTQLKTRLRNTAAAKQKIVDGEPQWQTVNGQVIPVIEYDWRRGIVESNPSAGWIKQSVLNVSDQIYKHGDIHEYYTVLEADRDPNVSTHITSTSANAYLPDDFVQMLVKNKPAWWVERYVYGSFLYADGLVYPSASKCICKTFPIPKHWKRIVAFDYGLADQSCWLFGAVDEKANLLYIYKEVFVNNRNIQELSELYFEASKDIPVGGLITSPIIDPKSAPRRDYDKKTLADNFLDYGIVFKPGAINREARVYRLNTYLESGRLKIMDCCINLIDEIKELKFKQDKTSTTAPWRNEPEDKNDHAIVCLEWICMELPKDPNQLLYGAYNGDGLRYKVLTPEEQREKDDHDWIVHALSDDITVDDADYYYME